MDSFLNPFTSTFHQAGEQALAVQKHFLDLQRAQMKLVEEQTLAGFKIGRSSFDASVEYSQNVTKSLVSAFAPRAPKTTKAASATPEA